MKKKSFAVLLSGFSLLIIAGLAVLFFLSFRTKDGIFAYVRENRENLEEHIRSGELSSLGFFGTPVKNSRVSVHHADEYYGESVDFPCRHRPVFSGPQYVGFFFSEGGSAYDIWCAPGGGLLKQDGERFEYREPNGDNRCVIEKICDNFYYYEAWF